MIHTPEPFGYFKPEPFGWTDCAETDDDAIQLFDKAAIRLIEKQRDELLAALEGLADDIESLIGESHGVIGLHLNGDVAPWGEIEAGGRFERLANLPIAHSTIASAKGGKPDGLRGFSVWFDRESWGHVVDGLILERERSMERKAANPDSNSNVIADHCAEMIQAINEASVKGGAA